jgi:hypothetical protein
VLINIEKIMSRKYIKYIAFFLLLFLGVHSDIIAQDSVSTAVADTTIAVQAAAATTPAVAAQEVATLDSGNTAWIIVATILV